MHEISKERPFLLVFSRPSIVFSASFPLLSKSAHRFLFSFALFLQSVLSRKNRFLSPSLLVLAVAHCFSECILVADRLDIETPILFKVTSFFTQLIVYNDSFDLVVGRRFIVSCRQVQKSVSCFTSAFPSLSNSILIEGFVETILRQKTSLAYPELGLIECLSEATRPPADSIPSVFFIPQSATTK